MISLFQQLIFVNQLFALTNVTLVCQILQIVLHVQMDLIIHLHARAKMVIMNQIKNVTPASLMNMYQQVVQHAVSVMQVAKHAQVLVSLAQNALILSFLLALVVYVLTYLCLQFH